jgi:solute carrier family 41
MVASTTMTAASLSGIILGSFMCTLVVLCRKYNRDPDNIAPAVASCLGDLVTLVLLGVVSTILIPFLHTPFPFILAVFVVCASFTCFLYTWKNEHVRPLLTQGWSPLFGAMAISSGTGIVLDMFVSRYEGFAVLAIVISGLPGAAGSILVSRLSTSLHTAKLALENGLPSFATKNKHPEPSPLLTMATLLAITLPVEVVFLSILDVLGWLDLPFMFIIFSIAFFFCAVCFFGLITETRVLNYIKRFTGTVIACHRASSHQPTMVLKSRSRQLRTAYTFRFDGPHWPAPSRSLL